MDEVILVLVSGSSSIKFSAYAAMADQDPALLFKGQFERVGLAPHMIVLDKSGATIADKRWPRGWLGILLDADANQRSVERISSEASRVSVLVIPTDEEQTIARQTIQVLGTNSKAKQSAANALVSDALCLEKQI